MASDPRDAVRARLQLARTAAREAGQLTLDFFRSSQLCVERKADDTPVTEADRQAERLIRARIEAAFPEDEIFGEELSTRKGTSGYRWVLDPIDGTKSFVRGVPLYTTLVGLLTGGRSIAGVIYAPALDELVYGSLDEGAWCERPGRPSCRASVSRVSRLAEGLFVTSEVRSFRAERTPDASGCYEHLERAAGMARSWGDGYGYLLVATGRAEVMVDPAMELWDAAAVASVVEAAGGTFTDWQGRPTIHAREGVATNGLVLDEVLGILQRES